MDRVPCRTAGGSISGDGGFPENLLIGRQCLVVFGQCLSRQNTFVACDFTLDLVDDPDDLFGPRVQGFVLDVDVNW